MAINNGCVPFTKTLISQAPDTSGVFALWQSGGIVYYGQAAEIRRALGEHLRGRACSGQRVSGCSWEVAADPQGRHRELLREYAAAHRALPLWNDPQRLPTD